MALPREILCVGCGAETLVRPEPVYEGFTRKGEQFVCVSCGHVYASEDDLPGSAGAAPGASIFTEADRSPRADIFGEQEILNCRRCRHYVVNPFTQRCGLHGRRVAATDSCSDFSAAESEESGAADFTLPQGLEEEQAGGGSDV